MISTFEKICGQTFSALESEFQYKDKFLPKFAQASPLAVEALATGLLPPKFYEMKTQITLINMRMPLRGKKYIPARRTQAAKMPFHYFPAKAGFFVILIFFVLL